MGALHSLPLRLQHLQLIPSFQLLWLNSYEDEMLSFHPACFLSIDCQINSMCFLFICCLRHWFCLFYRTLRFGKANIIVAVVFFHQVLPLSLTAFLFQGRAITNFPFLLSLLSLMLICRHFFLWSLIVCSALVLLPLFWQLLQTRLLLCPAHIYLCVIFVGAFDVWHDLTEVSAWRNLPF